MKHQTLWLMCAVLLLAAVCAAVRARRWGNVVETLLPFGDYRANTKVDSDDNNDNGDVDGQFSWNSHVPDSGPVQFSYNDGGSCQAATDLVSSQYVYIGASAVAGTSSNFSGLVFLNFDSERPPNGAVYFSSEQPDAAVSMPFEMTGASGKTIGICKFKAQKWRFDFVEAGLPNCEVYISTTYSDTDECKDIPYYLGVDESGNVFASMFKGDVRQRWQVVADDGDVVLVNSKSGMRLGVGGGYDRVGSFVAVAMLGDSNIKLDLTNKSEDTKQYVDWPSQQGDNSDLKRYLPTVDDPQGVAGDDGRGGWSSKFADIWNGTYSGAQSIVVALDTDANGGKVTVGDDSYDVQLVGSNMLVGRGGDGGSINFVGEMLSKSGELPRVKFYTVDGNGKYQSLSARGSPDNLAAYSMYIADKNDYLAKNGYGPIDTKNNIGYPSALS